MCSLTRSCFLLLVLGRLSCMPSLSSLESAFVHGGVHPFHAVALIPLTLAKVWLSPTLTLSPLTIWCSFTDGSVPFSFGKSGCGVLVNCSLCGTEATLSFSAGPVYSSFSAEACAILHAFSWSRQHQQVCHFSSPIF